MIDIRSSDRYPDLLAGYSLRCCRWLILFITVISRLGPSSNLVFLGRPTGARILHASEIWLEV
jgi:hypothetical protein